MNFTLAVSQQVNTLTLTVQMNGVSSVLTEVGPIPLVVQPNTPSVQEQDFLWIDTDDNQSFRLLNQMIVESATDLTPFLVGDEYILPSVLVVLNGVIDLGDKALRLSTGTILRGLANATVVSTNTNGVIRSTNIGSAVICREFNVLCFTGPCFVLTGTIEHQLNLFFIGMFGVQGSIITGFDVQSVKQCFISCANGLRFDGTTNKIFVSQCPFYSVTGSGMILSSTLVASVVDIDRSFFKYNSPAIGITAEVGYFVGEGIITGSLADGTAIPLVGLEASDVNWRMTNNARVGNSQIVGGYYLNTPVETVITTINVPVKAAGLTVGLGLNERFVATDNRLTYIGLQPAVGSFMGSFAVDTANNQVLFFYLAKNGVVLPETKTRVRVGAGTDERSGPVTGLVALETNDYVEIWVENNDSTANLTCLSLNLNAKA